VSEGNSDRVEQQEVQGRVKGAASNRTSWLECRAEPEKLPEFCAWVEDLLRRAKAGDEGALAELRRECASWPEHVLDQFLDVARNVQRLIIEKLAGRDETAKVLIYEKAKRLSESLSKESAGPLEKLLSEAVVACWLQTVRTEIQEMLASTSGQASLRTLRYLGSCTDRAYRRLAIMARSLAAVRRLA